MDTRNEVDPHLESIRVVDGFRKLDSFAFRSRLVSSLSPLLFSSFAMTSIWSPPALSRGYGEFEVLKRQRESRAFSENFQVTNLSFGSTTTFSFPFFLAFYRVTSSWTTLIDIPFLPLSLFLPPLPAQLQSDPLPSPVSSRSI